MAASLVIALREGLEAALVVSIVLAYLRQIGRRDAFRRVWVGVAGALALSLLVGVAAYRVIGDIEVEDSNAGRLIFAAVGLLAVGVLTWMVFWMRAQSRSIGRTLRAQVAEALEGGRSEWGVAWVAFFAVVRESLEMVLLMLAVLVGTDRDGWGVGSVVGLGLAVALGYAVYQGGRRINLGLFFNVTGGLVLVVAAGMLSRSVSWLQQAGAISTLHSPVWDVTGTPIVGHGAIADLLAGLFGWNPSPSVEAVAVWIGYLAVIGYLYFFGRPRRRTSQPERAVAAGQQA